jgi:hypothetical protein
MENARKVRLVSEAAGQGDAAKRLVAGEHHLLRLGSLKSSADA